MEKRMTKKDLFAELRELAENAERKDLIEFIDHEVDLLAKKSTNKAQTKTQKENDNVKTAILDALKAVGAPCTISELQTKAPTMGNYSNQKLSALLKQLVEAGLVNKLIDKKRTLFQIVE